MALQITIFTEETKEGFDFQMKSEIVNLPSDPNYSQFLPDRVSPKELILQGRLERMIFEKGQEFVRNFNESQESEDVISSIV